ncbi:MULTISPECIES: imidazole glycerol phosphate synthase subunit HisH [Thermococcus]|uniref:Imidazole glycerol phosphate synthase subunit HisH n=1 Tax=Thermococcus sibiricus TaxID=172049 RepID=A0A117L1L9_9EURY|nr:MULTISPECIES: imidazole glycerol phosphate synthase subunit HisH [Thermococcus]KUK17916.1 MAG: Imidazole glycerol phosphate synthase subunit HisH [Thermococcus sibiricus]KUK29343.1 MAG: Imidazole glycerol phosphate synthase subunit HisH [Thermococcus sp. 40_45]MBC7094647.1 imidazole glycerol phosphate synthase subunit HisH [Thermococcus sp.]HII67875.1 imidazole glycerol phosphate synthase subunit HisH [Thermococcaceae archaeon]
MIAIVDLGIGNLANVRKTLDGVITSDPYEIEKAEKIVLPGVGNFGAVMEKLDLLRGVILDTINDGKPFLGICLGLQLLFEESEENPESKGLGVFEGKVVRFRGVRTPHIGWNQVWQKKECKLFEGIKDGTYFYFVHSYYVNPVDEEIIVGVTDYESKENKVVFPSAVCKDNIFGVQFHPEKSSKVGLKLLANFRRL